jgi:hypothetical protein
MRNFGRLATLVVVGITIAACADEANVSGLRLANGVASNLEQPPSVVTLCKIGPAGSSGTFSVSATGGSLLLGSSLTLAATALDDPSGCVEVWRSVEPQPDPDVVQTVTITETGASAGTELEKIVTISTLGGVAEYFPPTNSAAVPVNYANGAIMFFKNKETPHIGGQGCTPGYWKVRQHWDSYPAPYLPTTSFGSVFANVFPGRNFVQVMSTGGGGLIALGRHAVAALLNAQTGAVDYGLTPAQVIAMFNAAVASGDYERTKNELAFLNERGCPLN